MVATFTPEKFDDLHGALADVHDRLADLYEQLYTQHGECGALTTALHHTREARRLEEISSTQPACIGPLGACTICGEGASCACYDDEVA